MPQQQSVPVQNSTTWYLGRIVLRRTCGQPPTPGRDGWGRRPSPLQQVVPDSRATRPVHLPAITIRQVSRSRRQSDPSCASRGPAAEPRARRTPPRGRTAAHRHQSPRAGASLAERTTRRTRRRQRRRRVNRPTAPRLPRAAPAAHAGAPKSRAAACVSPGGHPPPRPPPRRRAQHWPRARELRGSTTGVSLGLQRTTANSEGAGVDEETAWLRL